MKFFILFYLFIQLFSIQIAQAMNNGFLEKWKESRGTNAYFILWAKNYPKFSELPEKVSIKIKKDDIRQAFKDIFEGLKKLNGLKDRMAEPIIKNQLLLKTIEQSEHQTIAMFNDISNFEINEKKRTNKKHQIENKELQQQIFENNTEINRLTESINLLNKKEQLLKNVPDMQKELAKKEIEKYKQTSQENTKLIEKYKLEIASNNQEIKKLTETIEKNDITSEEQRKKISTMSFTISDQKEKIKELKKKINKNESIITSLDKQQKNLENNSCEQKKILQEKNEKWQKMHEELSKEHSLRTEKIKQSYLLKLTTLEKQNANMVEIIQKLTNEKEDTTDALTKLNKEQENIIYELNELNDEKSGLLDEINELNNDIEILNNTVNDQKKSIKEYSKNLNNANDENRDLKNENQNIMDNHEQLAFEKNQLQLKYEQSQNKNRFLKAQNNNLAAMIYLIKNKDKELPKYMSWQQRQQKNEFNQSYPIDLEKKTCKLQYKNCNLKKENNELKVQVNHLTNILTNILDYLAEEHDI